MQTQGGGGGGGGGERDAMDIVTIERLQRRVDDLEANQALLEAQALKDKGALEAAGLQVAEATQVR